MEMLFSLIPREKLEELLEVLSNCLELPIQLLNEKGQPLFRRGEDCPYCTLIQKEIFPNDECGKLHLKAGQIAYALGESYIFSCHASLNHIAFPLVSRKLLLGTVLIGPFLMDKPDSTMVTDFSEKRSLSSALCLDLYDELQHLSVVSPQRVRQISRLTDFLLTPLMADERLLMRERQEKLYQQSRINETIQTYKGTRTDKGSEYIVEKERELLNKVRNREIQQAKALLNDLLGFVLFVEGDQIEAIKSRAIELTTLLSRVAINKGAQSDYVLGLNSQYINKLQNVTEYEDICFFLQEIVTNFIQMISVPQTEHENPLICKAVEYIAGHFSEPLTIEAVGEAVGLSPSYFSALFSKQMEMGFHEYLTRRRIEEATNLLTATDYPISQIAVSIGYADQSSFTKAFKRITGLTPYQMR